MKELILPIAKSPIVGLQYLSYPLNILLCEEDTTPWFYSEYIHLMWYTDCQGHFTFCNKDYLRTPNIFPHLDYQSFDKKLITNLNIKIDDFIKSSINNGWYIISSFDE